VLTAERKGDWIRMDFPATPPEKQKPPAGLAGAMGAEPVWTGRSRADWLLELSDEAAVRGLTPDFGRLREVETRGVIVTARAADPEGGYDFVSRFFAPRVGIDEDPVTGSAHCTLAPFWTERLGRSELVGYQASARGGVVRVRARGERVELAGQAVTVLRGELLV
jgi:predicted PhzF superfamily epimerase YddE/YHI9